MMDKRKLIFIVDDDPFINTLVERRFSSEDYAVESYGYGEECLDSIDRDPDLIILDYCFYKNNKEVMNGMQVLDRIRQIKPQLPVIMLSGQDRGEVVLDLAKKGIDDYIIKDTDLVQNLNNAISGIFKKSF
jgi:CheY-like chemotaxis protein